MSSVPGLSDIALNVVIAVAGAGLGWVWPIVRQAFRTRRLRRFWRPFSHGSNVLVILGGHILPYEESGLVGAGDVLALTEMQSALERSRVAKVSPIISTEPDATVLAGKSLVVLGGPDANWLARLLFERVEGTLKFGDADAHEIAIYDDRGDRRYAPMTSGGGHWIDHAVIRRMANPWHEGGIILLAAGSYGFGTWGACRVFGSPEFLGNSIVDAGGAFEALVRVEVLDRAIISAEVVELRELRANSLQGL